MSSLFQAVGDFIGGALDAITGSDKEDSRAAADAQAAATREASMRQQEQSKQAARAAAIQQESLLARQGAESKAAELVQPAQETPDVTTGADDGERNPRTQFGRKKKATASMASINI